MVPNMEVSCCIDQDFSRVGLPAPEPLYEVRHSGSSSPVIQTPADRAECPPFPTRALTVNAGEAEVDQPVLSPCSEIVITDGFAGSAIPLEDAKIILAEAAHRHLPTTPPGDPARSVRPPLDGEEVAGLAVEDLAQCDEGGVAHGPRSVVLEHGEIRKGDADALRQLGQTHVPPGQQTVEVTEDPGGVESLDHHTSPSSSS